MSALDTWLANHPRVHDAIYWQKPPGSTESGGKYSQWSSKRKGLLWEAYKKAKSGAPTGLSDPPKNLRALADDESAETWISEHDAWSLYVTHLAQTLAVETEQRVPWSIATQYYDTTSLRILLDSRQFFTAIAPGVYAFDFAIGGDAVMAPPDCSYQFLVANDLIATASQGGSPDYPRDTIGRVLGWCRDSMIHFSGGYTAKDMDATWQYRGWTPVSRVIAGTHNKEYTVPSLDFRHWTGGCHGTVGFLRAVLRTINIPVQYLKVESHAQPYFRVQKRWLSHGDDPYDTPNHRYPQDGGTLPWPAADLLITPHTHHAWFGSQVAAATRKKNVGRRSQQLSLELLPNYLLAAYCRDKQAGLSHSKGEVFGYVGNAYTLAQLNAYGLWGKLDAKLASIGGCAQVP